MKKTTRRRTPGRSLSPTVRVVLATAAAAAVVTGVGVSTASASVIGTDSYTVEAFRETVKPWDSITIPSLTCPTGWLKDEVLSLGRMVPKGVQVLEPGGIGVTISATDHTYEQDWWGNVYRPITGTTADRGVSTATNWDPFSSHELVVNLHCTTDLTKASQAPR